MNFQSYLPIIYNYICEKWKTILGISIVSILVIFILVFILWIIISYYTLKWFQKNIDQNVFFNNYTYNSLKNLEKYGDLPIKNIYLTKQPINSYLMKFLNFISFSDYQNKVNLYIQKNKCNSFFPFHSSIIVEVELPNKFRKHIIIEKNNSININSSYKKNCDQIMLKVKMKNKNLTINNILEKTKNRLGCEKYFNWHIYKNNCQKFTEELVISISNKNKIHKKYYDFIYQNDFMKNFQTFDFTIHILNCSINIVNMFEYFTNIYIF